MSSFGGPAWTLDPATGQYYLHSFLAEQPDLNWRNPAVVAAMEDVIRFWLERGVDGFRVDVIHKMIKDAALRDNPPPDPNDVASDARLLRPAARLRSRPPEVHDIIRGWRRILDRYGERMMVGEVYLLDPAAVVPYYGAALDELQLAFNFSFLWTPWDAAAFRARVDEVERLLPAGAQPTYVLSSHDAPRHRTRFDDPAAGDARARVAALMLLTLRGTPFLYYGEELGMRDGEIPPERICDPVGKRFPGLGRDPERTPMQWDGVARCRLQHAADPWLPLAADWRDRQRRARSATIRARCCRSTAASSGGGNRRRRCSTGPIACSTGRRTRSCTCASTRSSACSSRSTSAATRSDGAARAQADRPVDGRSSRRATTTRSRSPPSAGVVVALSRGLPATQRCSGASARRAGEPPRAPGTETSWTGN